jgi:isopentenyldiphosphate isomerase
MSESELLDIYDDNLNKIGVKPRADVHRHGDWHRVFHCWVAYRDAEGQPWVVMQKRAASKQTFPNFIDVAAAGHYTTGETIADGIREVQEELGIEVSFDHLVPLGLRITPARYENLIDREFSDVFLLDYALDIRDYRPQIDEVAGLVAFTVSNGLALFSGEVASINARAAGLGSDTVTLRLENFIPRVDQYHLRAVCVIQSYFLGEKYLVI